MGSDDDIAEQNLGEQTGARIAAGNLGEPAADRNVPQPNLWQSWPVPGKARVVNVARVPKRPGPSILSCGALWVWRSQPCGARRP